MKKNARVTSASKSGSRASEKSAGKTAAKKETAKAAKSVKTPATEKASSKKSTSKQPAKAAPAKKAAAKPAAKTTAKATTAKAAAKKAAPKAAAKAKPASKETKPAKTAAKETKAAKTKTTAAAAKKAPAAKTAKAAASAKEEKKLAKSKAAPAAKAEPKRRGRKPAKEAPRAAFDDEPNAEALAEAEAEAGSDNDEEIVEAEPVAAVKKPRQTRRRRTRQLPRVPASLRSRPAWAEAWTALAESGLDAQTIPAVLRDASLLFIGLGELSPQTTEALFSFWEVKEAPGGIESILEEAFLSQPPQAERKSTLEAFFKEAMEKGSIPDSLILLGVARHVGDWRDASRRLKSVGSPYADDSDLFAHAREAVG